MNEKYICNIEPFLFLGSWHSTKKEILQQYQIQTVYHIGCQLTEDEKINNICYHFIELDDNAQSADKLPVLFDKIIPNIIHNVNQKCNTLVCCSMGKSRSPSFIMAYLYAKYPDLNYEDALSFINSKRKININIGFSNILQQMYNKRCF